MAAELLADLLRLRDHLARHVARGFLRHLAEPLLDAIARAVARLEAGETPHMLNALRSEMRVIAQVFDEADISPDQPQSQAAAVQGYAKLSTLLTRLGQEDASPTEPLKPESVFLPGHSLRKKDLGGGAPTDVRKPPRPVSRRRRRERPKRYANAALLEEKEGNLLSKTVPLASGQTFRLRLDIGKLSEESQVSRPRAFPDDKLPDIDIPLDVMVSSTDFVVAASDGKAPAQVAHGRFIVPRDGGRARNPDATTSGDKYLFFRMTAPQRHGPARGRIGYYYRNVLVQSQLLRADVGTGEGFSIETDYTMSRNFSAGLADMPERPRISVLTNDNGNGTHQIVLRSPGASAPDGSHGATFAINREQIGGTIDRMRDVLTDRAFTEKTRRKAQLIEDLRQIAPLGWTLCAQVPAQHPAFFDPLRDKPGDFVVQVCRPTSSGFAFPWALIYEIPITTEQPELCKLIRDWDERSPLVTGSPAQCPYGPHQRNVLCPFGFWGYRYAVDQISKTPSTVLDIHTEPTSDFVMGETQYGVKIADVTAHADRMRSILNSALPHATLSEGKDKKTIEALISRDLPFVYFYCHGERMSPGKDTYLGVGNREAIAAEEFIGLAWTVRPKFWETVHPLVFINACHSLAITPKTLVSYLDAFVGSAHAAGVIGTEVKVAQNLAMDIAEMFFRRILDGETVEHALHAIRLDYLKRGNLFGLVYTPYCWSELKFVH